MAALRPFDELAEDATVTVRRNQAMVWLIDGEGIEYVAPKWLWEVVEVAWNGGRLEAQADMRAAMGFVEVAKPVPVETAEVTS